MTEYIVGHILKAITYHHLLVKIYTYSTIRGYATIKINHGNKVICTPTVMHWATIRICATNQVNTVSSNLVTMLSNVVKFIPQNFEAIAALQAELCLVEFENLNACIRPLFANLVTYIVLLKHKISSTKAICDWIW